MKKAIGRTFRCNRGSTLVMVAGGAIAVFAFAAIAIDGALLMATRTQLHNAADAAALAGATALINGDKDEAINRAIDFAARNEAYQTQQQPVIITEEDITFPQPDEIRVRTHRTRERNDPLYTFFTRVINGGNTLDVSAVATAKVSDVCSSRCLKPWAVPDRWNDTNNNGVWDPGEYYDKDNTGYVAPRDVGSQVVLKVGRPEDTVTSGFFYAVNFPPLGDGEGKPLTGAAWYRRWIADCTPYTVEVGDRLQVEPGRMVGPTGQGVRHLIDLDPGAHWNPATGMVEGSAFALSPRIGLIPFFDPTLAPGPGRDFVTVVKLGAFFVEDVDKNSEVRGRFIQITTQGNRCAGGSGSSFVKSIVLVE